MISKIILTGDNSILIDNLLQTLQGLTNNLKMNFDKVQENQETELSADQVLINLSSKDDLPQNLLGASETSTIAYATASPKSKDLAKSSAVRFIATQRHLTPIREGLDISLGQLKNNITLAEPFVRDGSKFIFDLNVLRASEVHQQDFAFPSGLFSEDATQLFRYAGMNETNREVLILNSNQIDIKLIAQFVWYYAEAASNRFPDHPYFSNTVNEYLVNVDSLDLSISFYKSKTSGRWWVKVPDIQENKWKSCSYEDYQKACEDNLSPGLIEIISAVQ